MNIFILSTGRSGSTTFARACAHITNFSSAHESRSSLLGDARMAYPEDHIESDNRLAWFLGRLDRAYGDRAIYVHLIRDPLQTAKSFAERIGLGIMKAYGEEILLHSDRKADPMTLALDYCDTVNSNIQQFLRTRSKKMVFDLDHAHRDLPLFWDLIEARGDQQAALAEFSISHNAHHYRRKGILGRGVGKMVRIFHKLPEFLDNA